MEPITEHSFGIIPLRLNPDATSSPLVLLIRQKTRRSGLQWCLPKGHPEANETPLQSAIRELKEETGLAIVKCLSGEPIREQYHNPERGTFKENCFWMAFVEGTVMVQDSEVADFEWVPIHDAAAKVTFHESAQTLREAIRRLDAERLLIENPSP